MQVVYCVYVCVCVCVGGGGAHIHISCSNGVMRIKLTFANYHVHKPYKESISKENDNLQGS